MRTPSISSISLHWNTSKSEKSAPIPPTSTSFLSAWRVLNLFSSFLLDLPKLETVILGNEAFQFSGTTVFEGSLFFLSFFSFLDLPSLETIRLGEKALMGCDDEWCQLSMKRCDGFCDWSIELPNLKTFSIGNGCFQKTRIVVLSDLPLVEVSMETEEHSFKNVSYFTEKNVNQSLLKCIKVK